jgi:hypothetical protein
MLKKKKEKKEKENQRCWRRFKEAKYCNTYRCLLAYSFSLFGNLKHTKTFDFVCFPQKKMAFWWPLLVLALAYVICRFLFKLIPPNVPSIDVDASDGTLSLSL